MGARIIAVADIYDRMVKLSDKDAQTVMTDTNETAVPEKTEGGISTVENALTYISDQAGKRFDPDVASVFIDMMKK